MVSPAPLFEPSLTTLDTARLSIRINTEQAYVRAFQTCGDEQLKAYFGIATDAELQLQKDKVHGGLSTYRTSVVFFHLIERTLDKVIGSFAFHNWYPAHCRSEIGYAMTVDACKGMGYMTEAIRPIIDFGFKMMSLNRMEAFIHPQNTPSMRLVKRIGFQQEGQLREHYSQEGMPGDSVVSAFCKGNMTLRSSLQSAKKQDSPGSAKHDDPPDRSISRILL